MNTEEFGGVVRALIAAAGGIIIANGWADAETVKQFAGAATTLLVAYWSIRAKRSVGG